MSSCEAMLPMLPESCSAVSNSTSCTPNSVDKERVLYPLSAYKTATCAMERVHWQCYTDAALRGCRMFSQTFVSRSRLAVQKAEDMTATPFEEDNISIVPSDQGQAPGELQLLAGCPLHLAPHTVLPAVKASH